MDLKNGFLPVQDPCRKLTKEFRVLEKIAADLPKLLVTTQLRSVLEKLPKFSINKITKPAELERAMLLLSFLGHAYVWSAEPYANKIPASLASPWVKVAKKLGRPPVLSYASYALHNWRRINSKMPIQLGNIVLLQNFLGGFDEEWFVLIHVAIEAAAIPALQAVMLAQKAVKKKSNKNLVIALQQMALALKKMCEILDRMPEHCDPYIYYNRVRPYIHGWQDNPALPDGVIYEGEFHNQPQKFRGETGAQSSIIPALDAALVIQHQNDPLRIYLQEMRDYMPPAHRAVIAAIEKGPSIRNYVKENFVHLPAMRDYYNECIELVTRFRVTHLHYAAQYIQKQSQTSLANPTATGTGGTPFMTYLKKHKDEAAAHLL